MNPSEKYPSEGMLMSCLLPGHKINIDGQEMEVFKLSDSEWFLDRRKRPDEKLEDEEGVPYAWAHLRVRSGEYPSIGKAVMTKEELAKAISTGNFYIG